MTEAIERVLAQISPVIQEAGCRLELVGVEGKVATLRLHRPWHIGEDQIFRIRHFVERELTEGQPELILRLELPEPEAPGVPPRAGLDVTVEALSPGEGLDTAILKLSHPVGIEGSRLFSGAEEAREHPLILRLFSVPHVDAIMAKDTMLIVSRSGGTWGPLLEALQANIVEHFASGGAAVPPGGIDEGSIRARIDRLLEEEINPAIISHGGRITLMDVRGTEVFLHMGGGCQGCGSAAETLRHGVEAAIREVVPEITVVHDATDHTAGVNPYY
ncbi:MAG TPA: hypothetical protein ENK18_24080 [Deltaproteobacteria bacterium]|nr:hypothetical protein [Deltaproteobacteria bacterium]